MELRKAAISATLWFLAILLLFIAVDSGRFIATHNPISGELFSTWLLKETWIASVMAVIIPIPHVLIALLFKGKRNIISFFEIASAWYRWVFGLYGIAWAFILQAFGPHLAYL